MKRSTQTALQILISLLLAAGTIAFFLAWRKDVGGPDIDPSAAGPGFWAGSILLFIAICVIDIAWLIALSLWLAETRLSRGSKEPVIHVEKALEARKGSDTKENQEEK